MECETGRFSPTPAFPSLRDALTGEQAGLIFLLRRESPASTALAHFLSSVTRARLPARDELGRTLLVRAIWTWLDFLPSGTHKKPGCNHRVEANIPRPDAGCNNKMTGINGFLAALSAVFCHVGGILHHIRLRYDENAPWFCRKIAFTYFIRFGALR